MLYVVFNSYVESVGWCQTYAKQFSVETLKNLCDIDEYRQTDKQFQKVSKWQQENSFTCFIGYSCKIE